MPREEIVQRIDIASKESSRSMQFVETKEVSLRSPRELKFVTKLDFQVGRSWCLK